MLPAPAADVQTTVGLGSYFTGTKGGSTSWEVTPLAPEFRTAEALGKAAPSNQWYSSTIFQRWSQVLHAHPMTYRATEAGFEVGLPGRRVVVEDGGGKVEMQYPHAAALTIAPTAFQPRDSRLSRYSDWLAEVTLGGADGGALRATVLHGSPFSYYECDRGDVRIRLAAAPAPLANPDHLTRDPRVAAVTVNGHSYAVFAPSGATLEWPEPTVLVLHLPPTARYFSVAGLPDDREATLATFLAHAYAFPTETRADWSVDGPTSTVRTTFRVSTIAREGKEATTLMGIYPHQWAAIAAGAAPAVVAQYDSVRGPIRVVASNEFSTRRVYHGIMPSWPALEDPAHREAVDSLLGGDLAKSDELYTKHGRGTYWYGKALSAVAQLVTIADAESRTVERTAPPAAPAGGATSDAGTLVSEEVFVTSKRHADRLDELLGGLKRRLEAWFDGRHAMYFEYLPEFGSFFGVPQEFNSIHSINDHHFHYGYWLNAAAQVAFRDPVWAAPDHWGGMVGKLVSDIATDERGRADFPYLRNFDPYEGHSWASGIADSDMGNNQESSSEAVNAWAGLILWGEATGNAHLRDLGIYLYTTEVASVQTYWYDHDHSLFASEFGKPFASMVFGGKYAFNTWWTEEPRQIFGINAMPITPASIYLGADPDYIRAIFDTLPAEKRRYLAHGVTDGTPQDVWQDVLASFLALSDPEAGFAHWSKSGTVEIGETRTHTLFWLLSLREMGTPDFTVTADTPLYSVFKRADGQHTYLAYNARDTALKVRFSNGATLEVAPHSMARGH